jgi:hypothetical protein
MANQAAPLGKAPFRLVVGAVMTWAYGLGLVIAATFSSGGYLQFGQDQYPLGGPQHPLGTFALGLVMFSASILAYVPRRLAIVVVALGRDLFIAFRGGGDDWRMGPVRSTRLLCSADLVDSPRFPRIDRHCPVLGVRRSASQDGPADACPLRLSVPTRP